MDKGYKFYYGFIGVLGVLLLVLVILCVGLVYGFTGFSMTKNSWFHGYDSNYKNPCSNPERFLPDIVACKVSVAEKFYKYNLTDDSLSLTVDQLMSRGGDCKDWSEYYGNFFNDLGFGVSLQTFSLSPGKAHEYVMVNDGHWSCMINQLNYYCDELGVSSVK